MRVNRSGIRWYFALPVVLAVTFFLQPAHAQQTSPGVDCSQIDVAKLLTMDNLGAGHILIECGIVRGGERAGGGVKLPSPPNIRVSNRPCSSAEDCTKSESMVAASTKDKGQTIVVNYNDDDQCCSIGISGTSYSTDGGKTFHEILPPPLNSGHGFNVGDPIVVFNSKLNEFFAGDLAEDCGGFGIGLWSSKDGKTWTTEACPSNSEGDDRESMWVDNDPSSGTYGRMYVSFDNYSVNQGALSITHSDDGKTWTTPVILEPNPTFIFRDVQVTGTPPGARVSGKDNAVFVASMDEGGGGNASRQNLIFRSTDGGNTFTKVIMGPRFNPPGDGFCASNSYFYQVNPIIRHMGWGEPGVGPNGVVHYVYAGAGKGQDHGDIFYTRSTNNGKTWSKPIKLNTDPDGAFKTQWMPSLSVTPTGLVTASWYDRRKATSMCNNVGDKGCNYERVGRQSKDNGASWGSEITISSGIITQPAQSDPNLVSCYAGDYDYNTALGSSAFVTWTDGRRKVSGVNVQDVDFAKVPEP